MAKPLVSNELWRMIEPLLPKHKAGRPRHNRTRHNDTIDPEPASPQPPLCL